MKNEILLSIFPEAEQRLIQQHLKLVLYANNTHNLTRITSSVEAQVLHIEDSLVAFPEMKNAPKGKYADIGSGGGFPGIPLAIVTHRNTLLVDSVKKKIFVLSKIINELKIEDQIGVYAGRIEDLSLLYPATFSVLTARALSSLPSLLELASPLLTDSGQLICYKANVKEQEINNALSLKEKLGMRLLSNREVLLSDNMTQRSIYVFEKYKEAEISLPRRVGLAQKRPLT